MACIDVFKATQQPLIEMLGESNGYLIWVLGMYLEEADLAALASESLTDGTNDKKIDFIKVDRDQKLIVFCQGYYSNSVGKDSAPANKASDLNTAAAWLFSGEVNEIPEQLRTVIQECRSAIADGDIETIDLLYVHNRPESINVARELQTAATHVKNFLGEKNAISVFPKELGISEVEALFSTKESHIQVREDVICPALAFHNQEGPNWTAAMVTVPGSWLNQLYAKYGHALFSANYRGFLGVNKRKKLIAGFVLLRKKNQKIFGSSTMVSPY